MLYPSMLDAWKLTQWSLYISHYSELPSRLPERGGGGGLGSRESSVNECVVSV